MNANLKPLMPADFGLDSEQLTELVTGAQTYPAPVPDEADAEQHVPKVDADGSSPTS